MRPVHKDSAYAVFPYRFYGLLNQLDWCFIGVDHHENRVAKRRQMRRICDI